MMLIAVRPLDVVSVSLPRRSVRTSRASMAKRSASLWRMMVWSPSRMIVRSPSRMTVVLPSASLPLLPDILHRARRRFAGFADELAGVARSLRRGRSRGRSRAGAAGAARRAAAGAAGAACAGVCVGEGAWLGR